jgi:hypothetical protein
VRPPARRVALKMLRHAIDESLAEPPACHTRTVRYSHPHTTPSPDAARCRLPARVVRDPHTCRPRLTPRHRAIAPRCSGHQGRLAPFAMPHRPLPILNNGRAPSPFNSTAARAHVTSQPTCHDGRKGASAIEHLVQRARATAFGCTIQAGCAGSAATGSSMASLPKPRLRPVSRPSRCHL